MTTRETRGRRSGPKTHALHSGGSVGWAYFEETGDDTVHVTALTGASTYVDRDMTRDEARAEWKKLKAYGWRERTLADASREMPLYVLRKLIRD